MQEIIETLKFEKVGYGHFEISIEIDGEKLSTISHNALAIDVAFDDEYDYQDTSDRIYENRYQAIEVLVKEILRYN